MANILKERPFDDFRVAITNPDYFFGRGQFLKGICESPFQVRILLGGRRIGKTSTLRAIEWNLLNPASKSKAFPVFISLQVEQPVDLDNLRYLLIARLREAFNRWRKIPRNSIREMYRQFLRQVADGEVTISFLQQLNIKMKFANPDFNRKLIHDDFRFALLKTIEELRSCHFEGVCFLFDEAEFIVRQDWANDAWSYFRGLKDTDTALKPFFGILLSGYRDLKDYQQQIGSPLHNIAHLNWLGSLSQTEVQHLVVRRCEDEEIHINQKVFETVILWAGGHPYLTQQMLNQIFYHHHRKQKNLSWKAVIHSMLRQHERDFSTWWNHNQCSDGFGDGERKVYQVLIQRRQGSAEGLANLTHMSFGKMSDILDVLSGTGVIRCLDDEYYQISSKLFETWVTQLGNSQIP